MAGDEHAGGVGSFAGQARVAEHAATPVVSKDTASESVPADAYGGDQQEFCDMPMPIRVGGVEDASVEGGKPMRFSSEDQT